MNETGFGVADFPKGLFWEEETFEYRVLNEIKAILKDAISAFSVLGAIRTSFSSGTHLGSETGNLQEDTSSATPVFSIPHVVYPTSYLVCT